jgi:hypothetical protein
LQDFIVEREVVGKFAKMNSTLALFLVWAIISTMVLSQDYAEYARGAGMARKKNNR